jgi:hypothetical protein
MRNTEKGDGDLFPVALSPQIAANRRCWRYIEDTGKGDGDLFLAAFPPQNAENGRSLHRIEEETAGHQATQKGDGDLFRSNFYSGKSRSERFSPRKPSPSPLCEKRGGKGPRPLLRSGRSVVGVVGFFVLFTVLLLLVYKFYMVPWIAEAQHASKPHLRKMSAEALLLMCVLLAILLSGLLVTFRISRFFVEPPSGKRSQTKVVDAWSEAGKRLENDPPGDEGEDEEEESSP